MVNRDTNAVCTIDELAGSLRFACDHDGYIEYKVDSMGTPYDMNDFQGQGIILPNLFYWRKEGQR
jgi:hypothetical protein